MWTEIEERAVALLSQSPSALVPLSRLHGALETELGPASGSCTELYERLRRHPQVFVILEPPGPPWEPDGELADLRAEYERALREAGIELGPRVALATVVAPETRPALVPRLDAVLRCLEASLVQLWTAAGHDPRRRSELVEALDQAEALRRALTAPAPGPGPAD